MEENRKLLQGYYPENGESNGNMENEVETEIILGLMFRGILGLHWGKGKENGDYCSMLLLYWDYLRVMEKNMETTIVYWGSIAWAPLPTQLHSACEGSLHAALQSSVTSSLTLNPKL